MRKKIKTFIRNILGSEWDIHTKIFIMLTVVGTSAVILALIGDIIIGESIVEIIALGITVLGGPVITHLSVKNDKVGLGGTIIAIALVFFSIPLSFLFGGALTGGAVVWFVFSYLYIALLITGAFRTVLVVLLTIMVALEYVFAYFYPNVFTIHSRSDWFFDSAVSTFLVGFIVFFMVVFQYRLYSEENKKTVAQAKEIEEMNKSQNKFFSSMSHEIRTPINTIIGLNEMTLRENAGPEVAENSRNIQAASKILLSLINDILDMSKIESGKMDIVRVQYDVGKMLSEIVNMIWVKANEKGLSFSISVDPSMPSQLFSDEVRIKQILINLLNNAIKYTQEGSVKLSVHCTRTGSGKALISYSVEDTGMGIRKENIPYLFDAFRREDTEKNRYIEGTGLGLSIVKQLVELLGGTISVNSVYTKGSTFTVEIEQEVADDQIMGDFNSVKLHSASDTYDYHQSFEAPEAKVLVVDDNTTNLLVVKKLLKDTKVQVTTVDSGAKCLENTLKIHYDVILMDHLMPEMDGIECFHAIKEQPGGLCKETPVVALTANAGSENQALYRREGFDEYLVKPVDPSELERIVSDLLPKDMVSVISESGESFESDKIVRELRKKVPILVTTETMADIPPELLERLNIPVISCCVRMKDAVFYDEAETGSDGIVRYMEDKEVVAKSEAPSVSEYEEFFSEGLTKAQHIIHIATAKHASESYVNACEAALSFYNVRVIDSEQLSSGTGLLAIYAHDLAENGGLEADRLMEDINEKIQKIQTSFIIRTTDYLYRGGRLTSRMNKVCEALMLHPVIAMRDSSIVVSGLRIGDYERISNKYIKSLIKRSDSIDTSVLFITYVGMKRYEVEKIRDEVEKELHFDNIYLTKASPSIAINCGPGTFGLIFSRK